MSYSLFITDFKFSNVMVFAPHVGIPYGSQLYVLDGCILGTFSNSKSGYVLLLKTKDVTQIILILSRYLLFCFQILSKICRSNKIIFIFVLNRVFGSRALFCFVLFRNDIASKIFILLLFFQFLKQFLILLLYCRQYGCRITRP